MSEGVKRHEAGATSDPPALVERERELAEIAAALDRAIEGRGCLLVVEGPAGIGKTGLVRAAESLAEERGCGTLSARGGELERDFPYGVMRQLLEQSLRTARPSRRASLLAGAAALAAPVLGLGPEVEPRDRDPAPAILHGLYWLVSNLAEEGPLLISADDAQWADDPSLAFLYYLARRVEELPVCLLLARRRGEGKADELLTRIAAEPSARILWPAPLSDRGVAEVVGEILPGDADEAFFRACRRASGGNPFLLRELLLEVRAEGIPATAAGARSVEGLAPEAVARSVLLRLSRLPTDARGLARSVAVLGGAVDPRIAAALAELDEAPAARASDALAGADIFAPDRPLDFVHPVVRQVVYAEIPAGERALAHAAAARLLTDADRPPAQVASHVLHADPAADARFVRLLTDAADEALAGGAPRSAIAYLRRALAEPPSEEARVGILAELGLAQARVGDPEAMDTLAAALRLGADPDRRAEVALELARAREQTGDQRGGYEALRSVETIGLDPDLALRIDAERIGMSIHSPQRPEALARLRELRPRAEPPRPASAVLLACLGMVSLEEGDAASAAAEPARKALEAGLLEAGPFPFVYAAATLTWGERFEEAARAWDRAIEEGRRRGAAFLFAAGSTWRSHLRYRVGRLRDAEADARAALDLVEGLEWAILLAYTGAFLADVLIERGELDEAERVLERAAPIARGRHGVFLLDSRGRLRACQARLNDAVEDFRACAVRQQGFRSPGIIAWRSNLALALAGLGEQGEARRLANEEVELAASQGGSRALGVALRALGLVEGRAAGLDHLNAAVEALEDSPAALERARALTDLGTAMRRARHRKDARDPLRLALELAHRCGATALAVRAHEELLATGARIRRPLATGVDALTPSERRVAQLAAHGLSNRQIAQSLFVSMRTVATHLSNAYRKLGIERRDQLALQLDIRAERPAALG